MTNTTGSEIAACLALAAAEITRDDLDTAAAAARRAGALYYTLSKLVCDVEVLDESPGVADFILSYVEDGWNAAAHADGEPVA